VACAGLAAVLAASAAAQSARVSLSGRMGDTALLVIDGTPRRVALGQTERGVRLVGLSADSATVEVGGERRTLALGATPVDLGGAASPGSGTTLVLPVGSGGHVTTLGSINGRPVQFLVDTGATVVALSQAEAERIGLAYRDGPRSMVQTANGQVPVHRTRLASVRIGDVQVYDVEAVVVPASMDRVLLGNSFLSRFAMRRDHDTLVLTKRP
jgi:aspartyl protease family protein